MIPSVGGRLRLRREKTSCVRPGKGGHRRSRSFEIQGLSFARVSSRSLAYPTVVWKSALVTPTIISLRPTSLFPSLRWAMGMAFGAVLSSSAAYASAPELRRLDAAIQDALKTVESGSDVYEQRLGVDDAQPQNISIQIGKTDRKGRMKETIYFINLADLDPFLIKRDSRSKDVMRVELKTKGQLKTIRVIEDGEQKNYTDECVIYGADFENAKALIEAVKAAIPVAKKLDDRNLTFSSLRERTDWLLQNVGMVKVDDFTTDQKLQQLGDASPRFELTSASRSARRSEKNTYVFNLADLNETSVTFEVKGKKLAVELETKRGRKLIEHFENEERQSYRSDFEILMGDVNTARDVTKMLQRLIPEFTEIQASRIPEVTGLQRGLELASAAVTEVDTGSNVYSQTLTPACVTELVHEKTEGRSGKKTASAFRFNFADVNPKQVAIDVSGKELWLEIPIMGNQKLIRHLENGELQSYAKEAAIAVKDVEDARLLEAVLPRVVELCREDVASTSARRTGNPVDRIISLVGSVRFEDKEIAQTVERLEGNCLLRYKRITATKKSVEEVYEIGLKELDEDQVAFRVSGRELSVQLPTRYKDAVIKYYKDGESGKYQSELRIAADDVEQARALIDAVRSAVTACR
jgi:acetolactate synthase small subunit